MVASIVLGSLVAFVAVTAAAGVRRIPRRTSCPECGSETEPVQLPGPLRRTAPELRGRWCPACSWEGVGREGPEVTPGRPTAHSSGFRWGRHRLPQDFGFRFRPGITPGPSAPPPGPPAHPSGFRFGDAEAEGPASDPAAFTWREKDAPSDQTPDPEAFRWADPPAQAPEFRWGEPDPSRPPFRWKDDG